MKGKGKRILIRGGIPFHIFLLEWYTILTSYMIQGSHRDLELKFHDFSMTFDAHFLRIPWLRKRI